VVIIGGNHEGGNRDYNVGNDGLSAGQYWGKRKSRLVAGKAGGKKRKARLIKEIAVARTRAGNFDSIDKRRCFCSIDCAWDRGMAAYPNSKSVTNTGIPGTEAWQRIQIVRA
jgi:hypothetical protein